MSRINHERSILQLIDDIKKRRAAAKSPARSAGKQIVKRDIAALDATSKALVHDCAVRVLDHFGTHNDARIPQRLLEAVDGTTKTSLASWFAEFSSLRISDEDGKLIFDRSRAHRPGAAIQTPYWKLAKSTSPRRPFDFADDLTVFLRRSKKKIEAGAAEMALLIKIERLLDEWSRRF
ncbi:hypothetical protein M2171_005252 [Bradyrhizobium japonicum USDA 38]|uniref:hypothetical protein n=1 Tax=Bradyrhizobium japonicum TaxID=375 RepID=UPI000488BD0D|nr:hypothetical protein [Bradyrhizobium japonicum]MCS3896119.1 hypothetical protein [Bradyrhizobium japonicum USDA 38]MCS3948633.1 hypothetical protein [Bradyrhizobium japonicum]WLB58047.1 hypothetical protein QIH94_19275 [Bradyrhizobium japonicum]WLB60085.1 hypothetical protein QIH96_26660 [Bradyrhizobium japonicum]